MKAVEHSLIEERAYEIWEQSGRPHGLDKEHWSQAEKELLEAAPSIKKKPAAAKATQSKPSSVGRKRQSGNAKPRPDTEQKVEVLHPQQ